MNAAWRPELLASAPDSPLVIELNAESFEKHGDLAKAVAEYRILLQKQPDRAGIHFRSDVEAGWETGHRVAAVFIERAKHDGAEGQNARAKSQ